MSKQVSIDPPGENANFLTSLLERFTSLISVVPTKSRILMQPLSYPAQIHGLIGCDAKQEGLSLVLSNSTSCTKE